jgi:hypothetical protein
MKLLLPEDLQAQLIDALKTAWQAHMVHGATGHELHARKMAAALHILPDADVTGEAETAMVDAAMVEMRNIVPPLRRSECRQLICAALSVAPTQIAVPLTDDQIYEMYNEPRSDAEMLEFARAIEAAHGITQPKAGE